MKKDEKRIIRVDNKNRNKENPYLLIDRQPIKDLSPITLGIFIKILSQVDFYIFHPTYFYKLFGRKYVDASLRELLKKGYCTKKIITKKVVEFTFFENPKLNPDFKDDVPTVHLIYSEPENENIPDDVPTVHLIYSEQEQYDVPTVHQECTHSTLNTQNSVPTVHLINNLINNNLSNSKSNLDIELESNVDSEMLNEEIKNQENMKKYFTLKNKNLIYQSLMYTLNQNRMECSNEMFDKWYSWKLSKDNPDKSFVLEAYYKSLLSFIEKDKGLNQSKSNQNSIDKLNDKLNLKDEMMRIEKIKSDFFESIYINNEKHWVDRGGKISDLIKRIDYSMKNLDNYPENQWENLCVILNNRLFKRTIDKSLEVFKALSST